MKLIGASFIFIVMTMLSCSPDNNPTPPPEPPPVIPPVDPPIVILDTLADGWIADTSIKEGLYDIFFIGQTGYVTSTGIYKSTDGGKNWQRKYTASDGLYNIAMNGEDALFVVRDKGIIINTHDGANSFDSVQLDDKVTDVFFASGKTAFAVGRFFWRSDDAGNHWNKLYDFSSSWGIPSYRTLHFLNNTTGWIAGEGGVFKTTDGGISWSLENTPGFGFSNNSISVAGIYFTDSLHGAIVDANSLGITDNSGETWTKIFDLQRDFRDVHFTDELTGYVTDKQYVWKTTDRGLTWKKVVSLYRKTQVLVEVHFTDADHGWACGGNTILRYVR